MFETEVMHVVLSHVFSISAFADIDAVLLLTPRRLGVVSPLSDYFSPLSSKSDAEELTHPLLEHSAVYGCIREHVMPGGRVRRARVEDHDDLVPIFNEQTQVLTQVYGEFYLADLIEAQSEDNKTLVLEVGLNSARFVTSLICTPFHCL